MSQRYDGLSQNVPVNFGGENVAVHFNQSVRDRSQVIYRNQVMFRDEAAWAVKMPHSERPSIEKKTSLSDNQDLRAISSLFDCGDGPTSDSQTLCRI